MDKHPPIPTQATKPQVYEFAEQVSRALDIAPGDSLEPVIAKLGGRIQHHSPAAVLGNAPPSIEVFSKTDFIIHMPTTTSPRRDRFTLAHELGHLFLHFPMVEKARPGAVMVATRWVDNSDTIQQRAEWEANWFAAAFLMPAAQFRERWKTLSAEIKLVADAFVVSEQAAEIRGRALHLVGG